MRNDVSLNPTKESISFKKLYESKCRAEFGNVEKIVNFGKFVNFGKGNRRWFCTPIRRYKDN